MAGNAQAATSTPVRLSTELVEQARADGAVFNRSAPSQIEYWAKLGRAIENAPGLTLGRVRAALDGRFNPGDLTPAERPYFYEALDDLMEQPGPDEVGRRDEIRRRRGAVGDDENGRLVQVTKGGRTEVIPEE